MATPKLGWVAVNAGRQENEIYHLPFTIFHLPFGKAEHAYQIATLRQKVNGNLRKW